MPVSAKYAYFDHAAVAPLPDVSSAAIRAYSEQASQHGDVQWPAWSAGVARLREAAAELIHASTDEIALVNNTTQGINLVAEGFPWKSGDNVVVPENEFPSNLLPWRNLARRGVELRLVKIPPSGVVDLDAVNRALDAKTRMIAASWVGFASGYRSDVAALAELAHSRGCLLMLDAIQGLGVFPLDVQTTGVDFACADGHKWMLGPEGAGVLYVRLEHLNLLEPLGLGWNSLSAKAFEPASSKLKANAARYEGGSANMAGMLGLKASLELLLELGAQRADSPLAQAILENVASLEARLSEAGFQVHLPARESRSGIMGVTWPEADAMGEQAYRAARKHSLGRGVVSSVRGGRLRISTHAYNNEEDIGRLIDALLEYRRQGV